MDLDISRYPYKYETHLHTSQSSACGRSSGAQMARACHAAGYAGIIVTDHHFGGNTAADRSLAWEDWCDAFCAGYEDAAREGARLGLSVFFGWESGFCGTEFLVYGLDKDWLKAHPELRDCSVRRQFQLVDAAGGMVVQAHPFRRRAYISQLRFYPDLVHGVEMINAVHSYSDTAVYNEQAAIYAALNRLPVTAGSDIHNAQALLGGGMCFRRRITDIGDFIGAVRGGEDYILTDGVRYYEKPTRGF